MDIDVVVTGDEQANALLTRLAGRLDDGRPQLLGLVDTLLAAERERFATANWKRLGPRSLQRHHGEGAGSRPLVLTGRLMRSLTVRGARDQIIEIRPSSLRFGTSLYYARFHQRGQGVPTRKPVGVTPPVRQSLVSALRRLLVEDIR